jgi:hypothetical protein
MLCACASFHIPNIDPDRLTSAVRTVNAYLDGADRGAQAILDLTSGLPSDLRAAIQTPVQAFKDRLASARERLSGAVTEEGVLAIVADFREARASLVDALGRVKDIGKALKDLTSIVPNP